MEERFIIGIDLGTTNCAVGYVDLGGASAEALSIESFPILQLVSSGRTAPYPTLPSFLLLPSPLLGGQLNLGLPWDRERDYAVGVFAREEGGLSPDLLVSSAKSWLCHAGVDRTAAILPWGSRAVRQKVSPVEASARYLQHIREAWTHAHGGRFQAQQVIVTIPASFDQAARELTLQAAGMAGMEGALLLEEPLAAFYAWLADHEEEWQEFISPGDTILICDVGGGTTDFTLVECREGEKGPELERLAVGDHLLLGGDNIDLAIARLVEKRMGENLDHVRWQQLIHQCRRAKEQLLTTDAPSFTVRLAGRGAALVGGMKSAELTREEVVQLLEEQFYPDFSLEGFDPYGGAIRQSRPGTLPYESDPAVTRHLARFLLKQGKGRMPAAVLFNGGSLAPAPIRERIRSVLSRWAGRPVRELPSGSLDLAISRGAAYYGLVQRGLGLRVGGGSARSFYIVVEGPGQGDRPGEQAVCIVPRGTEEGSTLVLDRPMMARANQPVSFTLYSSTVRPDDRAGDVVEIDPREFHRLPPLQTVLSMGKKRRIAQVPVTLESFLSPVGTLEVACKSVETPHRWRLQFELRQEEPQERPQDQVVEGVRVEQEQEGPAPRLTPADRAALEETAALVDRVFSTPSPEAALRLVQELEEIMGMKRELWSLPLLRALFDQIKGQEERRGASPVHEERWFNLMGYTLRPGMGDPGDPWRIKGVWPLFFKGIFHPKELRVRLQWWIFWRRVAAGLSTGQQEQLFSTVAKVLLPKGSRRSRKKGGKIKVSREELREMWLLAAHLERIPPASKEQLGELLVASMAKGNRFRGDRWALCRIGARMPLYGPLDRVVAPARVEEWLRRLFGAKGLGKGDRLALALSLARLTGDRAVDLEPGFREWCMDRLREAGVQEDELLPLKEVVEMDRREQSSAFGEGLPAGIVLISH